MTGTALVIMTAKDEDDFMRPDALAHRPRASDARNPTETQSRGSVQPICWASYLLDFQRVSASKGSPKRLDKSRQLSLDAAQYLARVEHMFIQQINLGAAASSRSPAHGCVAHRRSRRNVHDSDDEANVIGLVAGRIGQEAINTHIMSLICCQ